MAKRLKKNTVAEEARSAVTKDEWAVCGTILRDAMLRIASRDEDGVSLHPEEARSAVTKDEGTERVDFLRDAGLRPAPQDEENT